MVTTSCERRVAAVPARVWEVLSDFAHLAQWADAVDHSAAMTEPCTGVGATRRVQIGSMVLLEKVTAWEPEQRLAYELDGLPAIVSRVVNSWTIRPDGDGSLVTLTGEITPGPRPPMRLAAKALARRIGATNEKLLAGLARAAEAS